MVSEAAATPIGSALSSRDDPGQSEPETAIRHRR
jgi:hypothetical protein